MFFIEEGQVESTPEGFEKEQYKSDRVTLDFARIMFIGLQMGLTQKEIGRMRYGTWARLQEEYRRNWNARIKELIYAEDEEQSILSLKPG